MSKVRNLLLTLTLCIGMLLGTADGQVTVPHTFTTSVPVSQLNNNFSTLGASSLNRSGGTITGNISVNSGVTIDGVDVGNVLGGSGTPTFSTLTVTGAGTAVTVNNNVAINGTGGAALDVAGGITAGTGNVALVGTDGRLTGLSSTYVNTGVADVAYSAGNFTANGALAWTVDAGDQLAYQYMQIANMMWINFVIANTSTGGVTNNELRIDIPGSLVVAANSLAVNSLYADDAGAATEIGRILATPGNSYITLLRSASANWTITATNNTTVRGQIWIKVS